jgi:hypothetical protein
MINVTCRHDGGAVTTHGVDADGMEVDETDATEPVLRLYKNDENALDGKTTVALFRSWISVILTHPVPRSEPSIQVTGDDARFRSVA